MSLNPTGICLVFETIVHLRYVPSDTIDSATDPSALVTACIRAVLFVRSFASKSA